MKHQVLTCTFLAVAFIGASAQVASHATANATPATSANVTHGASGKMPNPQGTAPQVSDKPVARVNGVVLTDRDLLREMYAIFPYARQHNGFPTSQEPAIRQGALEMIIFEELVYQDAVRRNIAIPPQQIKQAEIEFQKTFDSPEQYKDFLKVEMHGNPELVRQRIRRSLMIEKVLQMDVGDKSAVSVAEARDYYNKHQANFQQAEWFSMQTISILPPRDQDPSKLSAQQQKDMRKRADDALRQAKATKSYEQFGLLAEKISEDDYRVNMGNHKMVKAAELPPELVKVMRNVKPGEVSDLIQIQNAYTIVRVNAHNPAQKDSFEKVKVELRQELQAQKYEKLRSNLAKQLRAKAKIEVV